MPKIILINFIKYLLLSKNLVNKDEISTNEYRNIRKIRNKIVEILLMSKV